MLYYLKLKFANPITLSLIRYIPVPVSVSKVYAGRDYNVVHLDFRNGGKFDLILLNESDFDKEYKSILDYKKSHL